MDLGSNVGPVITSLDLLDLCGDTAHYVRKQSRSELTKGSP
jgi:hypothetical protein